MLFLLAEILNFQGSTHQYGVGSFSYLTYNLQLFATNMIFVPFVPPDAIPLLF